ncbi:hypothetical protein [Rhizobium sp. NZLR11]|uniref:hypothetical protein n=1 Tax=Rhizobium sp. NZLR11 TaxID=2731098 RepID=UPI001C83E324|nr:hypothetical protein [Rhizobium sp. NZLR11]MBX5206673.1 hypothetical protein [Rhizobium sp. NZLR11]
MAEVTDMNGNGNGTSFDPAANWGRLSERVENQGKDLTDLRSNMNTGFQQVNANLNALSNELRTNGRTQWPVIWSAIAVGVGILSGLGFMALQPIKDNVAQVREDAKAEATATSLSIASVVDKMVTQKEMEWRTARGAEDRKRQDDALSDLRDKSVPREELSRVWLGYDQRFTDLQRQIDESNNRFGNTYTLSDYIKRLTDRIDQIEQRQTATARP